MWLSAFRTSQLVYPKHTQIALIQPKTHFFSPEFNPIFRFFFLLSFFQTQKRQNFCVDKGRRFRILRDGFVPWGFIGIGTQKVPWGKSEDKRTHPEGLFQNFFLQFYGFKFAKIEKLYPSIPQILQKNKFFLKI